MNSNFSLLNRHKPVLVHLLKIRNRGGVKEKGTQKKSRIVYIIGKGRLCTHVLTPNAKHRDFFHKT